MGSVNTYKVQGTPPPWTVTGVDKFIIGALDRIERQGGELPGEFRLSICPWGERNAVGGTPEPVTEITDPRLRLVHFTGCGRPYLLALFTGEQAEQFQQVAMHHLPWSEHFAVTLVQDQAGLRYLDCTEDLWEEDEPDPRTLMELLREGELQKF